MMNNKEKPPMVHRLGVALAVYHWDSNKQVLYLLSQKDRAKSNESAAAFWPEGMLYFKASQPPTDKQSNIITGGIKRNKETPFQGLLREIEEEGPKIFNLFNPGVLTTTKPLTFTAYQDRHHQPTDFTVKLWAVPVPLQIINNFAEDDSWQVVKIKKLDLQTASQEDIAGIRPSLYAAAATIIDHLTNQERGKNGN